MIDVIFFKIALVFYLGASVAYFLFLLFSSESRARTAFWCAIVAFLVHTLSIMHRAIFFGFFPLATLFDVISFFAWLLVGLFLLVRMHLTSPVFGATAIPVASVMMIVALTLSHQTHEPLIPVLKSWWLPVHVVLAVAGNVVFALIAMVGTYRKEK